MTFPQSWTPEQKREAQRQKMALYRANHREQFKAYDKVRYPKRQIKRRELIFTGRFCKLCDIPLGTPIYGAKGTSVHCLTCALDKRTQGRKRMRLWRKHKAHK